MSSEDRPSFPTSPPGAGRWQPPDVAHLQELLPQYEVLELLGRGGMGAVYKARQKSLRRTVAIKILPVDAADDELKFAERFKNEAFALAQLNHPGIVNVHDAGEAADGLLYFVMEHVEGRDLAHEIAARGRLPQEEVKSIAVQVCEALSYLHGHGIVHRDIKPANILLDAQGRVKVADFGLAKLDEALVTTMLTRTGTSMGTAEFMAPECRRATAAVDQRADLFSLGVMLYQMLTGELPHGMFKLPSQMLPEIDERFDAIICKALEPKPEDRYQSAAETRGDLAALASARSGAESGAAPKHREPVVKKSFWMWPMIGVAVVVIVAGVWFLRSDGGKKPAEHAPHSKTVPVAAPISTGRVIDLLALVDVKRDAVAGRWLRSANGVQAREDPTVGAGTTRLQLPYEPPEEYDFEIEFTPMIGEADIRQLLTVQGRPFAWIMDVGGPRVRPSYGFENIKGLTARGDTEISVHRERSLANGSRHRSRVEVRKGTLRGFLDGEKLVEWSGDFARLSSDNPKDALRDGRHLGLLSYNRDVVFHRIDVREITGTGKVDESASNAAAARIGKAAAPGTASAQGWQRVELSSIHNLKADGGRYLCKGYVLLENLLNTDARDVAVKVTAAPAPGNFPLAIMLRTAPGGKRYQAVMRTEAVHRGGISYWEASAAIPANMGDSTGERVKVDGQTQHTLEFRAVNETLTLLQDGIVVATTTDARLKEGKIAIQVGEGGVLSSIEYAVLDGLSDAEREGMLKGKPTTGPAPDAAWTDWLAPIIHVWPMKDGSSAEPRVGFYRDGDGLSTDDQMKGVNVLPRETEDGAVRLTYLLRDSDGVQISVRGRDAGGPRELYFVRDAGSTLSITRMLPQKDKALELVKKPIPTTISPAAERTLEFRFVGDQLTATLNGTFTVSAKDATLTKGPCDVVLRKGVLLKRVEVREIGPGTR